jgi:RNA polymerase sigma-70 factor (ECF subfamily)
VSASFKQQLVEAIPMLRGFARSLSGNHDRADDLVQETLAKAIANRDKYRMGTNLHAWLVTILRNQYYSEGRRRWREVSDADGTHSARLVEQPGHTAHLELREFMAALQLLPDEQREALVLVGASGLSYEEAAQVLGTRVGTVKSRVSRARARLESLLAGHEDFVTDEEAIARSAKRLRQALSA